MEKLSRGKLAREVMLQHGLTLAESEALVETVFSTMRNALAAGQAVQVHHFGSFSVRKRSARKGRNPQTGETLKIPAGAGVRFAPAAQLRAAALKGAKKLKKQ